MEKQAPWFCSDSSAVPPVPFQFLHTSDEILSNQNRLPVQWAPQQSPHWPTLELRRNWDGTGLELRQHFFGTILEPQGNCIGTAEEPCWNWSRVPVSPWWQCRGTGKEILGKWYRIGVTGMESGQNQVPVSPCSMDRREKINFASGPPWYQNIAKKNLVMIDHPKVVKRLLTILSICHWKK